MRTLLEIEERTAATLLRLLAERTLRYDFTVWFWGDAIAVDGLLDAAELLDDQVLFKRCSASSTTGQSGHCCGTTT